MPNAAICAWSNVSPARSSKSSSSFGFEDGKPASMRCDAELVEAVGDAHLLVRGQRHPLALHAVAQGRVVELDGGHATCGAGDGTGTGSSHSR